MLLFAAAALQATEGQLFRSLKVSLLPPSRRAGWPKADYPVGATPDLLVGLYLSWVLGRIKAALGPEHSSRVSLNIAAPMDHLENQSLKERYLHVVQAAWEATFGQSAMPIVQGADLTVLRPQFEKLLERPVPDLRVRPFEILPETLAPLVSLAQDPKMRPGFFPMLDMGAGTTELSISRVNEAGSNFPVSCYADRSFMLRGRSVLQRTTSAMPTARRTTPQRNSG